MNLLGKAFQKIRAWVGLADASDSRLTPGHGWLLPVPVDARLQREDEASAPRPRRERRPAVTAVTTVRPVPDDLAAVGPLDSRFHVVSVACQRVVQIRGGSRLRLDPGGHKPCVVAVAEVLAGAVPYYMS